MFKTFGHVEFLFFSLYNGVIYEREQVLKNDMNTAGRNESLRISRVQEIKAKFERVGNMGLEGGVTVKSKEPLSRVRKTAKEFDKRDIPDTGGWSKRTGVAQRRDGVGVVGREVILGGTTREQAKRENLNKITDNTQKGQTFGKLKYQPITNILNIGPANVLQVGGGEKSRLVLGRKSLVMKTWNTTPSWSLSKLGGGDSKCL